MSVLITGATGFLGKYLMEAFVTNADQNDFVVGVARNLGSQYQCDLTDEAKVQELMEKVKPDLIIHAAAMTDVDKCEEFPGIAMMQNVRATRNIVQTMPKSCRIVYISTDMVYSGDRAPHREFSISESPLNMYGLSKLLGEYEVEKANDFLVLRTNMFGFAKRDSKTTSSLVDSLVQRFRSGLPVNLFNDVYFSPLWVKTIANMVVQCAGRDRHGVFNLASTHGMSKLRFALLLASTMKLPVEGARSIASAGLPDRVARPLDTRLDVTRAEMAFGITMPSLSSEMLSMFGRHDEKEPTPDETPILRH